MGITNFCKLLQPLQKPLETPQHFDSILFDVQPYIHVAISVAIETDETLLFQELCQVSWAKLKQHLNDILPHATCPITLILSFDGEGVPMKWPTQRERRLKKDNVHLPIKSKYRMALFGVNTIAQQIQNYFVKQLKRFPFPHVNHVYMSGCNVPGEGEHKIFHMAEALACRHPIVASVDQDVFILALLRLTRYDTIQIFRYNRYYPITFIYQTFIPLIPLETCSFLFGNDFIPPLITITPFNVPPIHQCLDLEDKHPVDIMAHFIQKMAPHLRYQPVTHTDSLLVECFWITFLWLKDYYTLNHFPQKYINNPIYKCFDRNQLLTALSAPDMESFERACLAYQKLDSHSITSQQAQYAVFENDNVLHQLTSYWVEPNDQAVVALHMTRKDTKSNSQ